MLTAIVALFQAVPAAPIIDGTRLFVGDSCYATSASATGVPPAGEVLRRVARTGRDRLTITIVSRFNGGPLLSSTLEVALADLRPIETRERTDGRTDLSVRYGGGTARGKIYQEDGKVVISTRRFDRPAWDDESVEFVLTTLPFAEGAHFDIPVFHFDRGPAVSRVDVLGSRRVDIDGVGRDAWVVAAHTRSDMVITFLIGKADRRLLEIDVGDVRSYLGGDCSELTP